MTYSAITFALYKTVGVAGLGYNFSLIGFSELYVINAPLLRLLFRLPGRLSVTRI